MAALADGIAGGERRAAKDSLLGTVVADIIADADDGRRGQTEELSLGDVRGRALEAAASDFLVKPDEIWHVLSVIERLCDTTSAAGA